MERRERAIGLAALVLAMTTGLALAGVSYTDPAGGWAYTYDGAGTAYGSAPAYSRTITDYQSDLDSFDALDGTWGHTNISDAWEGGWHDDADPAKVGGIKSQDGYLRIQTNGRTRADAPGRQNSKIFLAHDITAEGATDNIMDAGMTVSFRMRLNPDQPDGQRISSTGHGLFTVNQAKWFDQSLPPSIATAGTRIGFSMVTPADYRTSAWGSEGGWDGNPAALKTGFVMNNAVGELPSEDIDSDDPLGWTNPNIIEMEASELTQWHEFWITIKEDGIVGNNATHQVTVYMDGALTPAGTFYVTEAAGDGSDYPTGEDHNGTIFRNFLGMGSADSNTGRSASFDTDFLSWKPGIYAPVPEPMTALLLALGGLLVLRRR